MKKLLIIPATVLAILMMVGVVVKSPVPAYADSNTDNTVFQACNGTNTTYCNSANSSKKSFSLIGADGIITRIAQVVVWLVGIVSVLMVTIGGLRYVVSGGDSSGVASAKNTIIYALVGLALAIFAQVIVTFVLSKL